MDVRAAPIELQRDGPVRREHGPFYMGVAGPGIRRGAPQTVIIQVDFVLPGDEGTRRVAFRQDLESRLLPGPEGPEQDVFLRELAEADPFSGRQDAADVTLVQTLFPVPGIRQVDNVVPYSQNTSPPCARAAG